MKTISAKEIAIATSAFACAAMFSFGWSEQGGISLSVDKAQAYHRLVVHPYNHYYQGKGGLVGGADVGINTPYSGLSWYAVRAYYADGPWCGVGSASGYGYGTAGGGGSWTCYSGWADYRTRNGIACDPGTLIKGGDGILYVCQ
jgi:hypothetical protein